MNFVVALALLAQEPVEADGSALAAQVERLGKAMEALGAPLPAAVREAGSDAKKIQEALDPRVLVVVDINPESRVKAARGRASAVLTQDGWTPVIIKVVNDSPVTAPLSITARAAPFLQAKMAQDENLSGRKVEYAIALLKSGEAGKREATLAFDVGQGTQDLGFRAEVAVLFDVRPPAVPK